MLLAELARQDVVEILGRAGAAARVAVLERPLRGADVPPADRAAPAAEMRFRGPRPSSARALWRAASRWRAALAEQVVVEREVVEVTATLRERQRFDRCLSRRTSARLLARSRSSAGDDLVAEEAVRLLERRDQHVHRLLRRESARACSGCAAAPRCPRPRSRRKNASDVHDRFAVADERFAGPRLRARGCAAATRASARR